MFDSIHNIIRHIDVNSAGPNCHFRKIDKKYDTDVSVPLS